MRALVVGNMHLLKSEEGKYYSPSIYSYEFYKRYLNVFESIKIIGKVRILTNEDTEKLNLISGNGIEIIELPWYQGMKEMFKKLPKLLKIYKNLSSNVDCCIYRIAQVESFFAYLFRNRKQPFSVEVVNDPETFDGFFVRAISVLFVKRMCKKANGASYVTKNFLQKKYPNVAIKYGESKFYFNSYYSSIDLEASMIVEKPKEYQSKQVFNIVHVANAINTDEKGHYTLINACAQVVKKGYNIKVNCIGDGNKVEEYKKYVNSIGMYDSIKFIGRINNKVELFDKLKKYDLMVLPTQMEGLPRTIIEAMAMGLPCLSTTIAGIPELLDKKYLFDPYDINGFAEEIMYLINNPDELRKMSISNIEKAKEYTINALQPRRTNFYKKLKSIVNNK